MHQIHLNYFGHQAGDLISRVKIISESIEIVPLFLSLSGKVERKILAALMKEWCTEDVLVSIHGKEAKSILAFLEKHNLVETMWQPGSDMKRTKVYRAYYNNVHINLACTIEELSLVLRIASMNQKEFDKIDQTICDMVDNKGTYFGDVLEQMKTYSAIELKGIIKRSTRLEYRGHKVKLLE